MGRNLADVEYKMRMTQDLKDKIVESAKKHNRSMNADIVARLDKSFFIDNVNTLEIDQLHQMYTDLLNKNERLTSENILFKNELKKILESTLEEVMGEIVENKLKSIVEEVLKKNKI
ncbi:Arc family DNA-binding protein [Acinetobacter sp. V115_6]|uniref:Arc family DNA-binding protein n=1 Tax=Acinetobacter sp. V115_6 TaxID=3072987 RepID=UPI00287CE58F|nr:Arc family DNA-binding protein [Acinetobacter sp. V115_6]MDS7927583.1 Arc family DNA-binding protein [Acinetobacter sp. V115_6]